VPDPRLAGLIPGSTDWHLVQMELREEEAARRCAPRALLPRGRPAAHSARRSHCAAPRSAPRSPLSSVHARVSPQNGRDVAPPAVAGAGVTWTIAPGGGRIT